MTAADVIELINAITRLASTAIPLVDQVVEAMGSDDTAEVDAALARMRAEADRLHAIVPARLRAAATR